MREACPEPSFPDVNEWKSGRGVAALEGLHKIAAKQGILLNLPPNVGFTDFQLAENPFQRQLDEARKE
jgi:hypothetical protein